MSSSNQLPSEKPTVLIDTYSFHSFINAGYFYCWTLAQEFRVVVMVEQGHEHSPALQALQKAGRLAEVVVMPPWGQRRALHRWLARDLPALIQRVNPALVLMNNWHIFSQKYLSRTVQKLCPQTPIVVCLSVHQPITDFAVTDRHLTEARRSAWRKRWSKLPGSLVNLLHDTWGRWVGWRDFFVMPLLLTGKPLKQTHCPWRGELLTKDVAHLYDAIVCYAPIEQQGYLMEAPSTDKIHLVRHPMGDSLDAVQTLFQGGDQKNRITVLPSACLDYENGQTPQQQTDHLIALWGDALEIIQQKSGAEEIWWKLHPSFVDDPVMSGVTAGLAARFPNFTSMNGVMSAEAMMVESTITVGDSSTVLLWSQRLGGRITLSLNLFGMPGGDEMKHYPGIVVLSSLDEINSLPPNLGQTAVEQGTQEGTPSAVAFFQTLCKEKGSIPKTPNT